MPDGVSHSFVDAAGTRLHYVQAGPEDGPPIILLHGFPEFWWSWRKQIPALAAAGLKVIVPDMRGYGRSDCPKGVSSYGLDRLTDDIAALADALNIRQFDLVGHDWGGIVAWAVAAFHPERVSRLVILDAPHLDVVRSVIRQRPQQLLRSSYIGFFQLPYLPEVVLSARNFRALELLLTRTARPGTFSADDLARYREQWALPGRLTAMLDYYRALMRRSRRLLGTIEVPVRILWGRQDQALLPELAEASAAQCRDGELIVHDGATHWLHLEEPSWVAGHILDFVQSRPTGLTAPPPRSGAWPPPAAPRPRQS